MTSRNSIFCLWALTLARNWGVSVAALGPYTRRRQATHNSKEPMVNNHQHTGSDGDMAESPLDVLLKIHKSRIEIKLLSHQVMSFGVKHS